MSPGGRGLFPLGLAAFGVFGALWGVWAVLLADLARDLELSPGPLGLALSGGVLASMPAMLLGGRAADRWGTRAVIVASGAVMAICFAGLGAVGGYVSLLLVLLLWCATSGVYDVGINAFAMDLEHASGRRVLTPFHAAFSGGGAAGALAAGAMVALGVDYGYVYAGMLLPVALVLAPVAASRFPRAGQPDGGTKGAGSLYRDAGLLVAAAVATLAFFSEGTMEDWSGVYLRNTLALPALVGASGVAVYHGAMAVGRVGAVFVIRHLGNRRTLLAAGSLVVSGMVLSLSTTAPAAIVAGFLLVGLSLAAVTPIAFSVAGDLFPERSGAASSVVATLGYSGFLVGPAIVGLLGEFFGLRAALLTVMLAGVLIAALANRLGR